MTDICSILKIGKSTVYNRLNVLKKNFSDAEIRQNDFFYYDCNNKLFFTEKGFDYLKNFKSNVSSNSNHNDVILYQNKLLLEYKSRIDYLENENKKLLDLLSIKEQLEIAKNVKNIDSYNVSNSSIFSRISNFFKRTF